MEEYPCRVYAEIEGEWLPNQQQMLRKKLEIYFHKKKSGGGDCAVEFEEKGNLATIGFKQAEGKSHFHYWLLCFNVNTLIIILTFYHAAYCCIALLFIVDPSFAFQNSPTAGS